ncbi:MAG: hypothetical protein JW820_15855 [Spirochaetales bacterium]|nr:hypothetical protein [Spirochaetales bacterium]
MNDNATLFETVLDEFDAAGVLPRLVLVGSWCLAVYREHLGRSPQIPLLRTLDVDFLVPNPPDRGAMVDIPAILKKHGFDEVHSVLGDFSKFVHPELEIEFVTPEVGRGKSGPYRFDALNIGAQGLRYVRLAQQFNLAALYHGKTVRVPEPAAFVLLKYLASSKRRHPEKRRRDISTATQMAEFILNVPEHRAKLHDIFGQMPARWQKRVLAIVSGLSARVFEELAP